MSIQRECRKERERMRKKKNAREGDGMVGNSGENPREKKREQGGVKRRQTNN